MDILLQIRKGCLDTQIRIQIPDFIRIMSAGGCRWEINFGIIVNLHNISWRESYDRSDRDVNTELKLDKLLILREYLIWSLEIAQ